MSLFELMQWLGHRYAESTMNYLKASPTKLVKAFSDADYFKRNLRSIEALIDQEVIRSGAAVAGAAWKFYDLGHGYCAYDSFDQCRRRMVCAKCDFYLPKESGKAQILEAKGNDSGNSRANRKPSSTFFVLLRMAKQGILAAKLKRYRVGLLTPDSE